MVKTAANKMKAGSAVEKDTLCRILLLNVAVDNEKVAFYKWREPFASLMEATTISSGRASATTFERSMVELVEWFIAHPDIGWRRQMRDAAALRQAAGYRY